MRERAVVHVARCDLRTSPERWPFRDQNAEAIAAHWSRRLIGSPALFNGTIHILASSSFGGGTFSGRFVAADFAAFLYWRDHGYSDRGHKDCFGTALLRSEEGHVLLGRQRAGHVNGGLAYPPGGFIDPRDVRDDMIDIDGSIWREIGEETGLGAAELRRVPGYQIALAGPLVAIAAEYRSHLPAEALRARALKHLTASPEPELTDILIVRASRDLEAGTPEYARLLLGQVLDGAP